MDAIQDDGIELREVPPEPTPSAAAHARRRAASTRTREEMGPNVLERDAGDASGDETLTGPDVRAATLYRNQRARAQLAETLELLLDDNSLENLCILRDIFDGSVKGKVKSIPQPLADGLCTLLLRTSGKMRGTVVFKHLSAEAYVALALFKDLIVEVFEFQDAVEKLGVAQLRQLRFHRHVRECGNDPEIPRIIDATMASVRTLAVGASTGRGVGTPTGTNGAGSARSAKKKSKAGNLSRHSSADDISASASRASSVDTYAARLAIFADDHRKTVASLIIFLKRNFRKFPDWRDYVRQHGHADVAEVVDAAELELPLLSMVSPHLSSPEHLPPQGSYMDCDVDTVLRVFQTSLDCGLNTDEVERRRSFYGENVLPRAKKVGPLMMLWKQATDFMVLILATSAGISAGFGDLMHCCQLSP
eukprot:Opistho-1_new@60226